MITIMVHDLVLRPSVVQHPEIGNLFIAYNFLGLPDEDLESVSLPKGPPVLTFNFSKTFPVDAVSHRRERDRMTSALLSQDPSLSDVVFSVVNEPPDGGACYEVAVADINMRVVLDLGQDLVNEELALLDENKQVLGSLFVTVIAVDALRDMVR